jgi:multisubunit Na+/H+ antiporter MnhC subunit
MSKMNETEWVNLFSKVLFGIIILFTAITIYIFLWGKVGILPGLPNTGEDAQWIFYAIFSFAVVIAISVFHLYVTLIMQKKRR